jgi:hypothetical protein
MYIIIIIIIIIIIAFHSIGCYLNAEGVRGRLNIESEGEKAFVLCTECSLNVH